jgi:hypothetical protein
MSFDKYHIFDRFKDLFVEIFVRNR